MQARQLNKTDSLALEQEIERLMEPGAEPFSLFMVDVGDTGKVFVKSGPAASRRILLNIAESLQAFCRAQDRLCRIGDDIFCILLPGVHQTGHIILAAEKIIRLQSDVVEKFDALLHSMVRIGIASFPQDGDDSAGLIHKAGIALDSARKTHSPYVSYSPALSQSMMDQWHLKEDLADAIADKALELHYQPKFDMVSRRPCGAEALLRWSSPKHGPVSPEIIVSLASEMGLMHDLTGFVFTTALLQAAEWPGIGKRMGLSVNLEATSLQQQETLNMITKIFSIWGNNERDLTVEITEGALVVDSDSNFERLRNLRAAGIGISIDDFGRGYSSLSYFRTIPATELKIDRSFVAKMLDSDRDFHLVEAIIWLAHRFGLTVVAEGVQKTAEIKLLTQMKCDAFQGFYFSKPLPHDDFCGWLARYRTPATIMS
ncbi:MAG: GGDEF domain-containing phosphodiesterase [Gammaproteobacteria bacterium]|nr:GGDEF domain-containing phosphodiesterase [Gammaproteobacteria bacterium]MDH3480673.1 GGDEF domain-containing phosphodiesterase [Gammaproteobacteria bacterium]